MKKIFLVLIIFSSVTVTHNSSAMFARLLNVGKNQTPYHTKIIIPRRSSDKMQKIDDDYRLLDKQIQAKRKDQNLPKRPSDFISTILQNQSLKTEQMHPDRIFTQYDREFLDTNFSKLSSQYGPAYAWHHAFFSIEVKLENACDLLKDNELIHGAALVSLKQKNKFPKSAVNFISTAEISTQNFDENHLKTILEKIKGQENILLRE